MKALKLVYTYFIHEMKNSNFIAGISEYETGI